MFRVESVDCFYEVIGNYQDETEVIAVVLSEL